MVPLPVLKMRKRLRHQRKINACLRERGQYLQSPVILQQRYILGFVLRTGKLKFRERPTKR